MPCKLCKKEKEHYYCTDCIDCKCSRCGGKWKRKPEKKPERCPKCNSPYWDRPRRKRGV